MTEIEETVAIEQPIERVWAFVTDESSRPLRQTLLHAREAMQPAHAGVWLREGR